MYWNFTEDDRNRLGTHEPLNLRTLEDLNNSILSRLSSFQDIDCIVGVPRSGLLPATILALNLNIPLIELHDFLNGNLIQIYTRRMGEKHHKLTSSKEHHLKILIVDDATSNGVTFSDIKKKITEINVDKRFEIEFMAAYCTASGQQHVDYFLEEVPLPRVFEWNMMHHANSRFFCIDLDGVLCDDPTVDENDDGSNYEKFCLEARPRLIPTSPIGAIVTARLEKYRPHTEEWLRSNGVVYDRLIMCNLPTGEERRRLKAHAKLKADVYSTLGGMLFVESDPHQAREIFLKTRKPVFCFGTGYINREEGIQGQQTFDLHTQLAEANQIIEAMRHSTSWRITEPMRRVSSLFRRIRATS